MTDYRLLVPADRVRRPAITDFVWGEVSAASSFKTSIDHRATALGPLHPIALDLVRLGVGVFLVDRTAPRKRGWMRELALDLPVSAPDLWATRAKGIAGLLDYMTGDRWELRFRRDRSARVRHTGERQRAELVSLFSGGLDSFAGAVRAVVEGNDVVLVGHHDTRTVRGIQGRALGQVEVITGEAPAFVAVEIARSRRQMFSGELFPKEATSRTRSFLFVALGIAVAHSAGAETLWVPENGWVSVNPPLAPERRGALSTRTTHPGLLDELAAAVRDVGLGVSIVNPWEGMTKGEVVGWLCRHAGASDAVIEHAMAQTHSCARSNANYVGNSPLAHCGVCFACLIRRAAIRAAGLRDRTEYTEQSLRGNPAARLRWLYPTRHQDYVATRTAIARGLTIEDVLALDLPGRLDPHQILDLGNRGLGELDAIQLP